MYYFVQRQTITPRSGPFQSSVTLNQADPALGLTGIALALTGTVDGTLAIESGEASASLVTVTMAGLVTLQRPDGRAILTATPMAFTRLQLAAADGALDDAGPSGRTIGDLVGTDTVSEILSPSPIAAAEAVLLTGTGTVTLPMVASARVSATGPGNMVAAFHTTLAASVTTVFQAQQPLNGAFGSEVSSATNNYLPIVFAMPKPTVTTAVQMQRVADQTTGWGMTITLDGFDPSLGALEAVNVSLAGDSVGAIDAENLDGVSGAVTIGQVATLSLAAANGTVFDTVSTQDSLSRMLAAYDGSTDFGGASGGSVSGLSGAGSRTITLTDAATLAGFVGAAPVSLSLSSVGLTTIDGPGNLAVATTLLAGATVSVSYTYLPGGTQAAPVAVSGLVGPGVTDVLDPSDTGLTVGPAGTVVAPAGAFTVPLAIHAGGTLHVLASAQSDGPQIIGQVTGGTAVPGRQGAALLVDPGGAVSHAAVLSGAVATINGAASDTTVAGGMLVVSGTIDATNLSLGTLLLEGGTSTRATVTGGDVVVEGGGQSQGTALVGGHLTVKAGANAAATLVGAGTLTLEAGSTAQGIAFTGGAGSLVLRAGSVAEGIQNFTAGDTIELRDMAFTASTGGQLDGSGLTVTSGGTSGARSGATSTGLSFTIPPQFAAADVRLSADAAGTGTLVSLAPGGLVSPGGAVTSDYAGPVAGIEHQWLSISPETVLAAAATDDWFLHGGTGDSALAVHGGRNVLAGGGGSSFLVGAPAATVSS